MYVLMAQRGIWEHHEDITSGMDCIDGQFPCTHDPCRAFFNKQFSVPLLVYKDPFLSLGSMALLQASIKSFPSTWITDQITSTSAAAICSGKLSKPTIV